MTLAIGRFLESPVRWDGNPTPEERRIILDRIKASVSEGLRSFCVRQVRERPQPEWQQAYAFRRKGSTFDRKMKIEDAQLPAPLECCTEPRTPGDPAQSQDPRGVTGPAPVRPHSLLVPRPTGGRKPIHAKCESVATLLTFRGALLVLILLHLADTCLCQRHNTPSTLIISLLIKCIAWSCSSLRAALASTS
jgi:hypothetical protein